MANAYTLLDNLRAGRCSKTAEVRLLRLWEARNVKKGGELMSLDMLLVDEHSTLMQASIGGRLLRFRPSLFEGSLYKMSGFDVTRSNNTFRIADAPVSIRFNDGTSFDKMTVSDRVIPTELFRFRSYDDLLALANTNRQLPDIIGELSAIRSTITDRLPGAKRVMLTLRLDSEVNVCVSMFDGLAIAFHNKFDRYGSEPKIVLVTSVNPKIVGGRLYLNGTSATHIYFDCETAAGKEVFDRLGGQGSEQTASSSKVVHAQKIEAVTISELNQFIITADSQIIEFLCTAKVTGILLDDGWCYIGCSGCSKKLIREASSFTCVSCNETNALAALRYRVTLSVTDDTDTASFLGFDMEMAKLTNVHASEAARIVGVGIDAHVDTELPRSLTDIVGNTYTFQLKLNDFNFSSKHQTFTISRIFPKRELAPIPAFDGAEVGNHTGAVVTEVVATGTDAKADTILNVAEERPTSEVSSSGLSPETKGEDAVHENDQKRARVE